MRKVICLILLLFSSLEATKSADLIIFSYNRPMQLYALLQSISMFVSNVNQTSVLYRVGNDEISNAYEELKKEFPHIHWVKQGPNPRQDFKPLLLKCFSSSPAEYIFFAVDDDIVKDYIDLHECVDAMEKTGAYSFFFRLGENITRQYNQDDVRLTAPPCTEVKENIFLYFLNDGCYGDWRYCNNVDMTLYKKSTIYPFFVRSPYTSPNTLESNWAGEQNLHAHGLFFKTSKMFAMPLNIVQEDWYNPNERSFSATELFQLWKEGYAIDLKPYQFLQNNCAFVNLKPTFIKR